MINVIHLHNKACYLFSSIGFADVHPVVVFVSARDSDRFTADIHFKLEVSDAQPS